MAAGWAKLRDVGALADERAVVDFSIPLNEFPRVMPLLAASDGVAVGKVAFAREGRTVVAEVTLGAELTLRCQRCMAPMRWPVASVGRAALVATAAEAERVPEALETVLAPDYRISIRDLVEEELLLALPLVPRHEDNDCAGADAGQVTQTHRPFGQLGELFKRQ
ncbi:MAG TPA: YceD family protein [Steroidobacteraceae bacterium]|nr:YceD family protein [Steroidobacteraceae bacterium]